jgi:DNA-binding transcriptional MerR regulator
MGTYRISEVAERSGFPATTLRYYEQIELLEPPSRTASGHRVYDDRALARLRFVARAKALGTSLDELRERRVHVHVGGGPSGVHA